MKLSIIVPVYNTEKYLAECLESLIAQQWKDLEIICVNDGSLDHSADILAVYEKKDSRIRVITQENRGLSGARNSGLKAAAGEYVCFVDSDDAFLPDACERLAMECLGKEPDLVVFGAETIPEKAIQSDNWLKTTLSTWDWMCRDGNLCDLLRTPSSWPFVWRNCVRRSLLTELGLMFDEQVRYGEDTLFQLCLLPACKRISFISDRLYRYRVGRSGSLMEQLNTTSNKRVELHMPLVEKAAVFWQKQGWMARWGEAFYAWSLEFMAYDISKMTERRKEYAARLKDVWQRCRLEKSRCTNRCRVYASQIQYLSGGSFLPYFFLRTFQRGMVVIYRVYSKLISAI